MPAARPFKLGVTFTLADWVALTDPDAGAAANQETFPLLKGVIKNDRALGDGLVIDKAWGVGSEPPALPTKIKPAGCTLAPGLLAGETTFKTTDANCGESPAPDDENATFP